MNVFIRPVFLLVFVIVLSLIGISEGSAQVRLSKIKKKNGQIVEGVLKGFIVKKGAVDTKKEGAVTKFSVGYDIVKGDDIELIDEEGIHLREHNLFVNLSVSTENLAPDDLAVLGLFNKQLEFQLKMNSNREDQIPAILASQLPKGGTVIQMFGRLSKARVVADSVSGFFVPNAAGGRFIQNIEVTTARGIIAIPVSEIAALTAPAKTP